MKEKKKSGNPKTGVLPTKYWTHTVLNYNGEERLRPPVFARGTVGKMYYWPEDEWWDAVMIQDCNTYEEADDIYIAVCPPDIMDWSFWWEGCWAFWPLDIYEKVIKNG